MPALIPGLEAAIIILEMGLIFKKELPARVMHR
jgi:hypothetical protein